MLDLKSRDGEPAVKRQVVLIEVDLLITDLDGTLVSTHQVYKEHVDFIEEIKRFRQETGAVWAICTGRSRHGFRSVFDRVIKMGLHPDYIVTKDRYVFTCHRRLGHVPHFLLNHRIRVAAKRLSDKYSAAFDEWYTFLTEWDFGVVRSDRSVQKVWFRFNTEENAIHAAELIEQRAAALPHVMVRRDGNEVDISRPMFRKGLAVAAVARLLRVPPERILGIGDGQNDLFMLNKEVVGYAGCPANSSREVIELVASRGGHVASKRELAGATEILRAFRTGEITSEFPTEWEPPAPRPPARKSSTPLRPDQMVTRVMIVFGITAVIAAAIFWLILKRL